MKRLLLGLLLLLNNAATPPPAPTHVTFAPLNKAAYLQALKGKIVIKPRVTFPLKKQRGSIVIPTAKGQRVFRDGWIDGKREEETRYTYRGYWPSLHWHVVEAYYYGENYRSNVVTQNGQYLDLASYPNIAPDTTRFVVVSGALDGMGELTIQLFRLKKGVWQEVWKIEPKTWQVEQLDWVATDALLLQQRHWSKDFSRFWYTYAKLTLH